MATIFLGFFLFQDKQRLLTQLPAAESLHPYQPRLGSVGRPGVDPRDEGPLAVARTADRISVATNPDSAGRHER
jgi:hypothetical protein